MTSSSSSPPSTSGPGWVTEEGHFQRSDTHCSSSLFLQRFHTTPPAQYPTEFPAFVDRTMFILGDSVGRQLWDQVCDEIGAPKRFLVPPLAEGEAKVDYSEVSVCVQPELNFTILAYHQYGGCPSCLTFTSFAGPRLILPLTPTHRLRKRNGPDDSILPQEMFPRRSLRLQSATLVHLGP
jgi:hypothetical protein